jgi:immune inhibitor A
MSWRSLGQAARVLSRAIALAIVLVLLAIVLRAALARITPLSSQVATGPQPWSTPTATDTEALLAKAQISPRDPYDLARRFGDAARPLPQPGASRHRLGAVTASEPIAYSLGDRETFWVLNLNPLHSFQISATLRHISSELYLWVQDDLDVPRDALERSAETFERLLYPTIRRYFGPEWSPGIDNDTRLTVLNARFSGAVGYFSTGDEYPAAVMPYSNQREMFYINPESAPPGTTSYEGTLAHEFQHMVHWFADSNEYAWVNEGASELAMHLSGYARDSRISSFARHPDTQLNHWTTDRVAEHYAASFLFLAHFAERFGPEMMRQLVASELDGIAGFESVLEAHNTGLSFEDLFADWAVANYLDGESSVVTAPYLYRELDVHAEPERILASYPAQGDGEVHQYAADYIELEPGGHDLRLDFGGAATTTLVPNQAHSGRYQWWSNHGDNSDMTLTRSFDLSGLQEATLHVWLWYDIEDGWDYAYVEVSTDAGASWAILPGEHTTIENPSGNSHGAGYTGLSSPGGDSSAGAEWIQETFDLSPFAANEILVRFEYLTDEAVNHAGFCVDDIRIPELGYSYDAEAGDDGWISQGFVRMDNTLPQHFIVQLIRLAEPLPSSGPGEAIIERLPLPDGHSGTWTIRDFDESVSKVVLVISAVTRGSHQPASYHYEIRPTK